MKGVQRLFWCFAALLLLTTGCGTEEGVSQCVPGATQSCVCAAGVQGVQACNEAGTYEDCVCDTPPSDVVTQDTSVQDAGPTDEGPALDATDIASTPDLVEEVPTPTGVPIVGCDGIQHYLPEGFVSARIDPEAPVIYSNIGEPAQRSFQLIYTNEAGEDVVMDNTVFLFMPAGLASIGASGILNAQDGKGGAGQLQVIRDGVCLETNVTIISVANHILEGVPETIVDTYPTSLPEPQEPPSIDLVYPLHNAAWPSNFPAMEVQWFYGDKTTALNDLNLTYRIDITAEFQHIHVFAPAAEAHQANGGYVVQIPALAWSQIWSVDGGSPHQISVSAFNDASTEEPAPIFVSTAKTVTFTSDIIGGSVVYWNNYQSASGLSMGRIRELDMETGTPVEVPIMATEDGGCHGCHSVSPDATTVAVSFNQDTDWSDNMWSMYLFNMEDGSPVDWLHEDAEAFLAEQYTWQAAFSDAYWNEETKHMVVSQGGTFKPLSMPGFPSTTANPQQLYSVDLLNGTTQAITGNTTDEEGFFDTFPSFSSDGEFVVFVRTETLGMLGVAGASQLYRLQYNGGAGDDTPIPILGANLDDKLQYYPSLTPDDQYIIYNRLGAFTAETLADCPPKATQGIGADESSAQSYNNCQADLWMISATGGDPIRLTNASGADGDPYANSWPSIGTEVIGQHYWVAFSSYRSYGVIQNTDGLSEVPQIWLAAINPYAVMDGEDPSFSPIWLPNQDLSGNHIGQWTVSREP